MIEKKIISIMGPTAIGKTSLSLKLCNFLKFEIISVDSYMVYKKLDVGTGKIDIIKNNKHKSNLVDIIEPIDSYSVFKFCLESLFIIEQTFLNKKIPLFVGGNIMYNWFVQEYFLKKYYMINKMYRYKFINIVILPTNKKQIKLYIKKRFIEMVQKNMLEEVKYLYEKKKISLTSQSINSIGYKDIWLYFENKLSFDELKQYVIQSTLNLSKKQITWLKKWKNNLFFFELKNKNTTKCILNIIKNIH